MTEAEWLACEDPGKMLGLWGTTGEPYKSRKRRLFAVACCRRVWALLTAAGLRALAVAEAFADGEATEGQLCTAQRAVGHPRDKRRAYAAAAAKAACWGPSTDLAGRTAATAANAAVEQPAHPKATELRAQANLVRDVFGNVFRRGAFSPAWRSDRAVALARTMYEARDFSAMPILADALQEAGCADEQVLAHCQGPGPHLRGCWVVDLVLAKE